MPEFENKAVLVTGTTGIGRAIALRFAIGGAAVMACGIDEAANHSLAEEAAKHSLPLHVHPADVADPQSVQALVEAAVNKLGGIDILVNAAAIHPFGNVLETDPETWSRCMAVNVGGIFLLSRSAIPHMRK